MISAQAIYKRFTALVNEFGENSEIVKTAKQFIKENVADKFINPKTGNIMQNTEIDKIPKVEKRDDLIDSFLPTVNGAYTRASKQLTDLANENKLKEYDNARRGLEKEAMRKGLNLGNIMKKKTKEMTDEEKEIKKKLPKKPKLEKAKKAKDIKKMSTKEKTRYKRQADSYAKDIADFEDLKWDVYDVWKKEPNYPRNSEAGELYENAKPTPEWMAKARELMEDFWTWKAADADTARGPVKKDDYVEETNTMTEPRSYSAPTDEDYTDF